MAVSHAVGYKRYESISPTTMVGLMPALCIEECEIEFKVPMEAEFALNTLIYH